MRFFLNFILVSLLLFTSCVKDNDKIDTADYPEQVGKIIKGRCATSGCHNSASSEAAGGLNLTTWNDLFNGTRNGPAVVPFRADYSLLSYYVNSFSDLGITGTPLMPLQGNALSREEVNLINAWINSGAPNKSGSIKFSDNLYRKKYYVAHTSCKVVAVIDAETKMPMRYINVVNPNENCAPHQVKVSPDGQYWYVCFNVNGNYLRRYRTSDDSFAGEVYIGAGEWNTFAISPDSKTAFVIDWSTSGKIAKVDLQNNVVLDTTRYSHIPHGSAISPDGQFLYVTATQGNYLYKFTISNGNIDFIPLVNSALPGQPSSLYNAHEILFSPSGNRYYVTCETEKTVRVFDSSTDACIAVIPLSGSALEMAISPTRNLLFVTSWDAAQFPGVTGAVAVIDMSSNSVLTYLNSGTQPHGIGVDEQNDIIIISNRNLLTTGPTPHHSSVCGGRNGYLSFASLSTLNMWNKKVELSVDPYSVFVRP